MEDSKHLERVKSFFSQQAPRYHSERYEGNSFINHCYRQRRKLTLDLIPENPGTSLDIGCGPGEYLEAFYNMGWEVSGCDLCPEMVSLAKSNTSHLSQLPKICEASVGSLPYKDQTFDLITVIGVLNYVADIEKALSEVARVLKTSGVLILQVAFPDHLYQTLHERYLPDLKDALGLSSSPSSRIPLSKPIFPAQLRDSLNNNGFCSGHVLHYGFYIPFMHRFLSQSAMLLSDMMQSLPFLQNIPYLSSGTLIKTRKV